MPMFFELARLLLPFCLVLVFAQSTTGQKMTDKSLAKNSNRKNIELAKGYLDQDQPDSALMCLNIVLSKVIDHEEALGYRAQIYFNEQAYESALTDFIALSQFYPENPEYIYSKAIMHMQLEHYELAIADLLRVLELPGTGTSTAFYSLDQSGQYVDGISTMSMMEAQVQDKIGLCYYSLNDLELALDHFNTAISMNPQNANFYVNRALCYEKLGLPDRAESDYSQALALNPNHEIAAFNQLKINGKEQDITGQLTRLNDFVDAHPDLAEGFAERGLFLYQHRLYNRAEMDFLQANYLEPNNPDYMFNLALALQKNGKASEAEKQLVSIIDLDPMYDAAYFNLGNLQFRDARFEEAIVYFTLAHELNPLNKNILHNRALAYHAVKNFEAACEDIKKVIELDPSLGHDFYEKNCINK